MFDVNMIGSTFFTNWRFNVFFISAIPLIISWDPNFNDGCYWNVLQNVTNISSVDKYDALEKMLHHLKPENNLEMVIRYMTKYMPYTENGALFLELLSGDGEFICNLAKNLSQTDILFQPSEKNASLMRTISNNKKKFGLQNILEPIRLDPCSDPNDWFDAASEKMANFSLAYIFNANAINLMHWNCTKQIFRAAQRYLKQNGSMFFYGTFSYGTVRSPKANKDLHNLMKMCNPDWGLRDAYREMTKYGAMLELYLDRTIFYPTPLYSEMLVWKRMHDDLSRKAEKVSVASKDVQTTERMLNFGAAERNKQPILDVLKNYIENGTFILEIASGSGQHVTHFARHFTNVTFQPTDYHSSMITSISAYKDHFNLQNVLPAKYLNVEDDPENWLPGDLHPESADYIFNSNMIHVTNYSCTEGLFRGCGRYLKPGGLVFLYGPFAYDGLITPSSNVEFDKELKSSNPSCGLRDVIRQLVPEASKYRIRLETQHQLPSNNQLLVWKKHRV